MWWMIIYRLSTILVDVQSSRSFSCYLRRAFGMSIYLDLSFSRWSYHSRSPSLSFAVCIRLFLYVSYDCLYCVAKVKQGSSLNDDIYRAYDFIEYIIIESFVLSHGHYRQHICCGWYCSCLLSHFFNKIAITNFLWILLTTCGNVILGFIEWHFVDTYLCIYSARWTF